MARGSSTKKVARAARAGGGRVRGVGQRGLLFPVTIVFIVVLGTALIVFARIERREATAVPPQLEDHWHAAYAVYVCDEFVASAVDFESPVGIHSHGDNVVHIHPFSANGTGNNATLGVFLEDSGIELSDDSLTVNDETHENGDDCGDEPARVVVAKWDRAADPEEEPELITEDLTGVRFRKDGEAYTIAFVPEGAEIPKPDTATNLEQLGAVDTGATPQDATTTTAGASTSSTEAQGGSTTSVAPATTTTGPPSTGG
jgi:hypothetical protein